MGIQSASAMKFPLPIFHKKDLVIAIHGFGKKTKDEMGPLALYLEKEGFEVWTFSYYDPEDLDDVDFRSWIVRCEVKIRKAIDENRKIHLLGFSMGGVIASYLASVYPVCDLLLAAPAFYPIDFSKIEKAARNKVMSSGHGGTMSSTQIRTFLNIVSRYRSAVYQVKCPILILHGSADEVIPSKSSRRIFAAIPNPQKYLVFLEGAKHRFLYDGAYESLAFPIIRDYFRQEIHPQVYPTKPLTTRQANKAARTLEKQKANQPSRQNSNWPVKAEKNSN